MKHNKVIILSYIFYDCFITVIQVNFNSKSELNLILIKSKLKLNQVHFNFYQLELSLFDMWHCNK